MAGSGTTRRGLGPLLSILCLALSILAPSASTAAEPCKHLIVTGNPEYPPYLWRDPSDETRLIGANADLMQLVAKELGITIEMRYGGPWGRVQEEVRAGRADMIAGAFFTLPRLEYMDYFYPPFRDTRSVIWTREAQRIKYSKWADLRGLQGVTVINNSFGEDFDRFARESLKITTVSSLEQALKILQSARADYLIYEEDPGLAYAAKLGISGLRTVSPSISNESLYFTMSHKSACNSGDMRGRLSRAIYQLHKQATMNKLVESNIQLWRQQSSK